jgi:hypothetical protein
MVTTLYVISILTLPSPVAVVAPAVVWRTNGWLGLKEPVVPMSIFTNSSKDELMTDAGTVN